MTEHVLPALIDPHVHPRDFGQAYKEDFETCTRAAAAGGVATIGAMPNYEPALAHRPYSLENMQALHDRARGRIHTDVGMWAAGQPEYDNVGQLELIQPYAFGMKFYMEVTQGNDTQFDPRDFQALAQRWHEVAEETQVIAAHAEDDTIEEAINMIAGEVGHPLYIPHVNNEFVLRAIIKAKEEGLPVYSGVCPHHLFMTEEDVVRMGWYARMKPRLETQRDQDFLWNNLEAVDVFETDHAPHAIEEKDLANSENPEGKTGKEDVKSFGVPGLEAMLPLLYTAVKDGKLTAKQLIERTSVYPAKIFGVKLHPGSSVKIREEKHEFTKADLYTKCGWSPYEGRVMAGKVVQLDIRGKTVYRKGVFTTPRGQILRAA